MTVSSVVLNVASLTDTGLKRTANEDSVLDASPVFLVADGMGGHEAGDRASAAVVAAFEPLRGRAVEIDDVRDALSRAAAVVEDIAAEHRRGAGSTVTGVALLEHEGTPHWLVFNVGDSRVYRHHGNELTQLTIDHSLGQELVDAGELRAEDLASFSQRNVITRAIGAPDSTADSWLLPVVDGERLLLCSDGLSGEVSDEAIRATLTMTGRPETAAAALVRRALQAGGRDNVSVIVIDVVSGGARTRPDDSTGGRIAASALTDSMLEGTTIPVRAR
ncbi:MULTISPECIES: PP2C family protein-serine/threonine phosphatase [Microbacterium]|uniref:Protein phosphatase 2C domain-containing protein n=2 Tax=Microbacterium maritypicum TaxID=33918 RepID=A0ACD4B7R3_MICMQ|nr:MULTISPECIES: protein phosphatase 2C domain-containing protein [Microbacterium]EYT57923.1 serine/threonine protein phosphatase [Microbacterium sp. UCD-TDU]MBP5803023.1 serine/threonine-protein phosphatase [Microbacterium liquefaciens]UTT53467.1 protein phosphatase 2C domain-containing protein [Microbacterium liquefaciens]WEF21614.1 protein phosphatase 2C domain-containing protein [Microbacterium liquefaciens]